MTVEHKLSYAELAESYAEELRANLRAKGIEPTLEYIKAYGDAFVLEDEEVSQSIAHIASIHYFSPVLEWLFHTQNTGIAEDFLFYLPGIEDSKVSPEIAVVDGLVVDTSDPRKSYGVGEDGPPPRVAFEFASERTWNKDLTSKRSKYAQMGVKEYFVCDPNPERVWQAEWLNYDRLAGWRLNPATHIYVELNKDAEGRLWSEELESWVKLDSEGSGETEKHWLRLYDLAGNLRLTETQAAYQLTKTERERANAERERANQFETALVVEQTALKAERQRVAELEALLKKLKPE